MTDREKLIADAIRAEMARQDDIGPYPVWLAASQADFAALARAALTAIEAARAWTEPTALPYTNWRGETAVRSFVPLRLWWGATEWHPEPGWLMRGWDTEKQAERDFALSGFAAPSPTSPEGQKP